MLECTCHISELRCNAEKCLLMKEARESFKIELNKLLLGLFQKLKEKGFGKKESIRALRREANYKNELQYDIFDQIANFTWRDNER